MFTGDIGDNWRQLETGLYGKPCLFLVDYYPLLSNIRQLKQRMFQHVPTSFSHQKISETTRLRSKVRLAIEAAADGLNGFLCLLGIAHGLSSHARQMKMTT